MATPEPIKNNNDEHLLHAQNLVDQLQAGNDVEAGRVIEQLTKLREGDLFQEVGKLTRELHDTLKSFRNDSRLESLMQSDIPDAKERLNYVVSMTEEAANKTLNALDETLPISREMGEKAHDLGKQWRRFMQKDVAYEEFRAMTVDIEDFFSSVETGNKSIQENLSEAYMAQGFQDLTGQVIGRVINLVQDVEQSLVEMIRISGSPEPIANEAEMAEKDRKGHGYDAPGLNNDVMQNQDEVDDLLSTLGF